MVNAGNIGDFPAPTTVKHSKCPPYGENKDRYSSAFGYLYFESERGRLTVNDCDANLKRKRDFLFRYAFHKCGPCLGVEGVGGGCVW